jgi:hypothetical protein
MILIAEADSTNVPSSMACSSAITADLCKEYQRLG